MPYSSPPSRIFRACPPFESISQISRGPYLPLFALKEINEPSGEYESAQAISRSIRDLPLGTENSQMLRPPPLMTSASLTVATSSTSGWAFAKNFVQSRDQAASARVNAIFWRLSRSGREIV